MPLNIPKLKFGDTRSREWCEAMGEKVACAKREWTRGTVPAAAACMFCGRDIYAGEECMTRGAMRAHVGCLQDLRDLALRSGLDV